ncbi:hypothetical protein CERSUDRAFT_111419 [Gelatoporia subvermispora B]|uniref:Uncharacterized protein n=1 Tax=Ceriporiopsis subvermispora (strain B) TaxID=914234 RepID=M2PVN6_CERS8|nr:hypothetical protein CERSUDRAFT_111419 [Gelatoporia subvermispora B]
MKLSSIQPEVGEYGYLHPQTRAFIRLGNAFELMQREDPYLWNFVSYVDDTPTELTWSYVWDARSWRYPLHRGSSVRCAISRPFLSVHMGEFFWFHACNVAEEHGISLQDLILIDEVTYSWQIQVTEDYNGKGCQELFFHQMPCSQTGSLLSPFGCWSTEDTRRILDEETAVSLPGVDLSAVEKVSYVFLNETREIGCVGSSVDIVDTIVESVRVNFGSCPDSHVLRND